MAKKKDRTDELIDEMLKDRDPEGANRGVTHLRGTCRRVTHQDQGHFISPCHIP